jgi:hypothetical protein
MTSSTHTGLSSLFLELYKWVGVLFFIYMEIRTKRRSVSNMINFTKIPYVNFRDSQVSI